MQASSAELNAHGSVERGGKWGPGPDSGGQVTGRALTYRVGRRAPGTISLWTIQPVDVWQALQEAGCLWVDPGLNPHFDDYHEPYDWMRSQMSRRLKGYLGHYPWWAFDHRADLRTYRYLTLPPGRHVQIELSIPRDRVLLSAYGAWDKVRFVGYLPQSTAWEAYEKELDEWDAELKRNAAHMDNNGRWPELFHARVVQSWNRIFDVDDLRETNRIQATFECLKLEEVVSVTEFTSRVGAWLRRLGYDRSGEPRLRPAGAKRIRGSKRVRSGGE